MKILLLTLIIFFNITSFGQSNPIKEVDLQKAKSWPYNDRDKIHRELCRADSIRAVSDSKKINRYFIQIPALAPFDFHPSAELNAILKKYHITWGGTWMGSDLPGSYSNEECYKIYSSKFTEQKFGKSFINNLIKKSVRQYQRNNPDVFFDGGLFFEAFYKGDKIKKWDFDNQLNRDFFKKFTYPIDYVQFDKNNDKEKSFSSVDIRLNKKGKIIEILPINHHFQNSLNKKHSLYFEKELISFIKKSKWSAAEYLGQPVNSVFTVIIIYK